METKKGAISKLLRQPLFCYQLQRHHPSKHRQIITLIRGHFANIHALHTHVSKSHSVRQNARKMSKSPKTLHSFY